MSKIGVTTCVLCSAKHPSNCLWKHLKKAHQLTAQEYYVNTYLDGVTPTCPTCGGNVVFLGLGAGFRKHCSVRCSVIDPEVQKKQINTNLSRYGVTMTLQNEEVQRKAQATCQRRYGVDHPASAKETRDKIKETNLRRYGVENAFSSEVIRKKIRNVMQLRYGAPLPGMRGSLVREKIDATSKERYGGSSPFCSKEVREKGRQTTIERYGTDSVMSLPEIKEKVAKTNLARYGAVTPLLNADIDKGIKERNLERWGSEYVASSPKWKIERQKRDKQRDERLLRECGLTNVQVLYEQYKSAVYKADCERVRIAGRVYLDREAVKQVKELYEAMNSHGGSSFEKQVQNYLEDVCKVTDLKSHCRTVIYPLELDLYSPSLKLAVECNGVYWHSTSKGYTEKKHLQKTEACEQQGVKLIHISSWEWENKQEQCKALLRSACKINQRTPARKTGIVSLTDKEYKEFLEQYHLQGYIPARYKLGLTFKGELVQVISVGKARSSKWKADWELLRSATKAGVTVQGGLSKLIAHLPDEVDCIYSYVDRSKYSGVGLHKAGWKLAGTTRPNYHYYKDTERLSRQAAQKHKLAKLLGEDNFNPELTEERNMTNARWLKMFDCGNFLYVYNRKGDKEA